MDISVCRGRVQKMCIVFRVCVCACVNDYMSAYWIPVRARVNVCARAKGVCFSLLKDSGQRGTLE